MQSKARLYASVLVSAFEGAKGAEILKRADRFKALLKKRGDLKIAGKVLREFAKAQKAATGKQAVLVSAKRVAKEGREKISALLEKKGYQTEERVAPELIGGLAIILENEILIDGTIQSKLARILSSLR